MKNKLIVLIVVLLSQVLLMSELQAVDSNNAIEKINLQNKKLLDKIHNLKQNLRAVILTLDRSISDLQYESLRLEQDLNNIKEPQKLSKKQKKVVDNATNFYQQLQKLMINLKIKKKKTEQTFSRLKKVESRLSTLVVNE